MNKHYTGPVIHNTGVLTNAACTSFFKNNITSSTAMQRKDASILPGLVDARALNACVCNPTRPLSWTIYQNKYYCTNSELL